VEEQLGVYGILRLAKGFNIKNTFSSGPQLGTKILILFCRGNYRSMVWHFIQLVVPGTLFLPEYTLAGELLVFQTGMM